jgi:penicillin-binding protein 1A
MPRKLKYFFKVLLIAFALGFALSAILLSLMIYGVIDITSGLSDGRHQLSFTTFIYAKDENDDFHQYEALHAAENREWVDFYNIPQHLREGIVAIEDARFWNHAGVDWLTTSRAMIDFITRNPEGRGGSTITQQLVKNLTGETRPTVTRKVTEIIQALALERQLSKEEILELYLNTIYLSQGCHGVGVAANVIFGKSILDLTLAECALIAGITQFPARFDPFINPEASIEKRNLVLREMFSQGYINEEEFEAARNEELRLNQSRRTHVLDYFSDQVVEDVLRDLVAAGFTEEGANRLLFTGGLQIYATVNPTIQKIITDIYTNPANFPTARGDVQPESAIVVMDPYTGAVVGLVGGRGEKTSSRTLNRATQSLRQPGSAIKPISTYAPALEYGIIRGNSTRVERPVTFGSWSPRNAHGGFRGEMTVHTAMAISSNTVAVEIVNDLGVSNSFTFLRNRLGITSLEEDDRNLAALALGGMTHGMSVLEITAAYAAFANHGIYNQPYTYTKVVDSRGRVLLENRPISTFAMREGTARTMNSLLLAPVTSGTATGANFRSDMHIAGKTGTTDDDQDRWFVGYTPYYVAGVWFGFDQPRSMRNMGAGNPSVSIWSRAMSQIHRGKPGRRFDLTGVVSATITLTPDEDSETSSSSGNSSTGATPTTAPDGLTPTTPPLIMATPTHTPTVAPPPTQPPAPPPVETGE